MSYLYGEDVEYVCDLFYFLLINQVLILYSI